MSEVLIDKLEDLINHLGRPSTISIIETTIELTNQTDTLIKKIPVIQNEK